MKRLSIFTFVALIVLSLVLTACGGTQPAANKVRVATDATWPPFEIVDETTKELVGFDIDMLKAIGEKAGLELEFINVGFDPLLAGISECQYDAAISAITITEERKQSMLFSDPYINAGQIVSVRADNTEITGKDSLSGKTVGAQIGTTGAIEIERISGATLKTYDTVDLAFLDLGNGQIDAVVADYPTAVAFVAQQGGKLITVGEVFTDENYGIAVCKNNQELLDKINKGLAEVKAEGIITQLEEKWLAGSSQ